MNCKFFSLVLTLACIYMSAPAALSSRLASKRPTLSQLSERCAELPEQSTNFYKSAVSLFEFNETIAVFKSAMSKKLARSEQWVNHAEKPSIKFKPFVQKLVLPEGSQVAMWGDLHGSVHSLLRTLIKLKSEGFLDDNYKITKKNFYMFFLGDFVDRGKYGVEVIYTLLRLQITNPERVFLVRGNHEDAGICEQYGFGTELNFKFGLACNKDSIYALYEYLPMAIFLGKKISEKYGDFILCCHGGIEPGFNPAQLLNSSGSMRYAWLGTLKRGDWMASLPAVWQQSIRENHAPEVFTNFLPLAPINPLGIGFLWNDFIDDISTDFIRASRGGCALSFGADAVLHYMYSVNQGYRISKIIRAHQHNGQMLINLVKNNGVCDLWDGLVYTLLSAPAMGLEKGGQESNFACDSYVILTANAQWPIKHYYTPMPQQN